MRIVAVVVTYNRKKLLYENIENLLHQTKHEMLDVLIIDNASTDGTKEYISDFIDSKAIMYINTGSNLGGAGGFQYGINYAAQNKYDYIWVMDDDCMPTETALEELLTAGKKLKGDFGFLSSKVLWTDGQICKMNVQRRTVTRTVKDFSSDIVKVEMASFVSLFLPVKVIKDFGVPIKEFFIWTDDWEYTRRISRQKRCYLINPSVVIHKSASNIGANIAIDTVERLDRYKFIYRNDVVLYRREGIKGIAYLIARTIFHIIRVLVRAKDYRIKRILIILTGTLKGINFKPVIKINDN